MTDKLIGFLGTLTTVQKKDKALTILSDDILFSGKVMQKHVYLSECMLRGNSVKKEKNATHYKHFDGEYTKPKTEWYLVLKNSTTKIPITKTEFDFCNYIN